MIKFHRPTIKINTAIHFFIHLLILALGIGLYGLRFDVVKISTLQWILLILTSSTSIVLTSSLRLSTKRVLVIFFLSFLVEVAILDTTFQRRILLLSFCLPLISFFRSKIWKAYKKIPNQFTPIKLIVLGNITTFIFLVHLPPFYGGIAGWEAAYKDPLVYLSGIKIYNKEGDSVWYSNGITSPLNFPYRLYFEHRYDSKKLETYIKLLFDIYKRSYKHLKSGFFPSQYLLKEFAYPGHNPYSIEPYNRFPPSQVTLMTFETIGFDLKSKKKKVHNIDWKYDLSTRSWEKRFN